jgi:cytochrome c553
MKTGITTFMTAAILSLFVSSAIAADNKSMAHAEKLHSEKCMSCHKTDVYTRKDRRVTTLPALKNQVENCMKGPAEANWSKTETDAVVDYLNQKFYKF